VGSSTIFLPKAGCGYGLSFRQLLDANITKPLSIIEFTSIEAIKSRVMKGIGLTILPKNSVRTELHKNRFAQIDWISDFETSVSF
jgi:DNA-binding transcriptional LysR family regulator